MEAFDFAYTLGGWSTLTAAALGSVFLVYATFYLGWVVRKPAVIGLAGSKGDLKERLIKNCPILSEYYWPTFWAVQYHLATITRFLMQKKPNIRYFEAKIVLLLK